MAYQHALAVLLDVGLPVAKDLRTPDEKQIAITRAVRRSIILSRHIRDAVPAAAYRQAARTQTRLNDADAKPPRDERLTL